MTWQLGQSPQLRKHTPARSVSPGCYQETKLSWKKGRKEAKQCMFHFIWHIIRFFFNPIPRLFHYCIFPTRLTLCSPRQHQSSQKISLMTQTYSRFETWVTPWVSQQQRRARKAPRSGTGRYGLDLVSSSKPITHSGWATSVWMGGLSEMETLLSTQTHWIRVCPEDSKHRKVWEELLQTVIWKKPLNPPWAVFIWEMTVPFSESPAVGRLCEWERAITKTWALLLSLSTLSHARKCPPFSSLALQQI